MKVFPKKSIVLLLYLAITFCWTSKTHALYDPRSVPNNQYGIHIVDPLDLSGVTDLLNSSGGRWGYVKVVIPETDRNSDKWNTIFKEFRRKRLIPIVRIATQAKGNYWTKPSEETIRDWPQFLNSLSWPIENRYVVLFNEPNHAKEWGGSIDPEDFGRKTIELAQKLKQASGDYFILPAGLDVSASTNRDSMDAETFLRRTVQANPGYLSVLDGWNSHSYPNPAFSASPANSGRGSVRSFEWELSLIRTLGETRDLPVLIGETGWTHSDGQEYRPYYLSPQQVGSFYQIAGETVWRDKRIFAVTPFLYNYQGEPFSHFSFRRFGGTGYHPHYFTYMNLPKTFGTPKQRESFILLNDPLPKKLVAGSAYTFPIELKNTGQSIISDREQYMLYFEEPTSSFTFSLQGVPEIEPEQTGKTTMTVFTPKDPGEYNVKLTLRQLANVYDLAFSTVSVLPPPTLTVTAQLGWQRSSEASSASVLIFDGNDVLYEFHDLPLQKGIIQTPGVLDIVPERSYRIVTLIPYFLPRQVIQPINQQVTLVQNNRFLPLDMNNNQYFDWGDILTGLKSPPAAILSRFFGN